MATQPPRPGQVARKITILAGLLWALTPTFAGQGSAPAAVAEQTNHARLWQAYSSRFISADGRVIDPLAGDRTTSEGQSYALFFALVNDDRAHFEKVLSWTQSNLSGGDLGGHLPAWTWGHSKDGHWGITDPNSASDSDLWIAYDLIEAGRLWNDHHYAGLGRQMLANIARHEVSDMPGFGPVLLPGPVGFHSQRSWVLNPSYTPVFILERMAVIDPAGPWADVAATVPALMGRSTRSGFAMDWVSYTPGEGFVPSLITGKKDATAVGSYDAIRVYLWAGMLSDSSPLKSRMIGWLQGMKLYLERHGAPPEKVSGEGVPLNGDGPVGFSAALLPYLRSISTESAVAQQLVRIGSQLDEKSNLYGTSPTYYDQNLILFGSGWIEKRFQFGANGELLVRWSR